MQSAHDERQGGPDEGPGERAPAAGVPRFGDEPMATEGASGHRDHLRRGWRNPSVLLYLMGPAALVALLALMHFGYIVRRPAWVWIVVFCAVPLGTFLCDRTYRNHPSPARLHLRLAAGAAAVTAVIYLTGWGPVLVGAYAILAIDSVARDGSSAWKVVAVWSLAGIGTGQLLVSQGWLPSVLTLHQATALALMGTFVLLFIIRVAAVIMEKQELAEASVRLSEDRFRSLIEHSSDTTLVLDGTQLCLFASPAVTDLLGYLPSEIVGTVAADLVHPDDVERVQDYLHQRLQTPQSTASVQFRMRRRDGSWCEAEAVVANQMDRPSVGGIVVNLRDITERKEFEALLAHRALHDPLTGLANRQLLFDRAEQMLSRARRALQPVAAFFIDLDNFKDTNDSLGHDAGDRLLQSVAARLVAMLRASDTVGRIGGDEFVVLTEGLSLAAGAEMVAERIHEVLREPFQVEGFEGLPISVTASIGIATGDRTSAQELLRDADIALYRAKAAGRDRSVIFEAAMQSAALDRLALRADLDTALSDGQFFLVYQPIFDLVTMRISGVEALLRWRHPTKGVISPDNFIPALEDSGLIVPVGRWVLREACRQTAAWQAAGHALSISVNVSMRQLETDALVGDVTDALDASGLLPRSLTIEVTESTLMRDTEATVSRLQRLKEIGVLVAIDDFGTGYSSMAYLRQFPVDVLKIDRSFVAEVDDSAESAALIHTLVELGRTLGLVTLAEGIEDAVQLDRLRFEHCDSGQGFVFSRPVDPDQIEELLRAPLRRGRSALAPAPG